MKRAGLLLLVAAVLGILWIASRGGRVSNSGERERRAGPERSETSRSALEGQKKSEDSTREVESSAPPTEARDTSTSIRIRSSAGLLLAFVEIQEGDDSWKRRDLNEGRCELGGVALPCRLRAPGHAPASVERLGGEIVLDPDALLVLEAPGLRACTEAIEPFAYVLGPRNRDAAELRARLARTWTYAFLDENRWAIAVTSKLLADFRYNRQLDLTVEWPDRRRAEVKFEASPGARGTWNVPCASDVEVAPMNVTLVWPSAVTHGETTVNLWRIRGVGTIAAEHFDFPWGTVDVSPPANASTERHVESGTEHVSMGWFPKGVRCGLAAIDSSSGSYGGILFEHDGSPRTLEMRPGLAITGRIGVPSGVLRPVRAFIDWKYLGPDQDRYNWTGGDGDAAIGAEGEFEVRGLKRVPVEQTANLDPPPTLDLTILAPGFERFERTYSTGGARRFDCGTVDLVPSVPQLVLAPGTEPKDRYFGYGQLFVSTRPEVAWEVRGPRRELDGSLSLFLWWVREEEKEGYRCWIEPTGGSVESFPSSPGEFALLVDRFEKGVGLRSRADGRYETVATRDCKLAVDCRSMPSRGGAWILGWTWRGMSIACSRITPEFEGEHTTVDLVLPEDGVTLWWSGSGRPPEAGSDAASEGGSMPATGSPIRLTLP